MIRPAFFVWRHSMPGAGTHRVESPWLTAFSIIHFAFSILRANSGE
jgi:hypothetical protein